MRFAFDAAARSLGNGVLMTCSSVKPPLDGRDCARLKEASNATTSAVQNVEADFFGIIGAQA